MYCLGCQYDLHGQVEPRCPECGRQFDFADSGTWYDERFSIVRAARHSLAHYGIWILRLVLVLLMVAWCFGFPVITRCGGYNTFAFSYQNLNDIYLEWHRQCGAGRIDCRFNRDIARAHMRPRFSPTAEMAQIDAKHAFREDIEEFGARTFGPAIFGLLLAMTFAGRTRKWLLVAASLTLVQSRVTCVYSEQLAALRFPGSHAYIDDFFFLDPPFADQTDTWPADSTLIAIEKQSLVRGAKAVALRNGVITNMADNEIESLLACPPPPVSKRN